MIEVVTGIPGSGKSLWTADKILFLLRRNLRWWKKTGQVRYVYSNIKLSEKVENEYGNLLQYWDSPDQLVRLRDVDIVWDEIATHLDATQWMNLSLEVKRFLQQHRKRGIDIYGNTQEFVMIDVAMRRLTQKVYYLNKLFGSRDPSPTRPPVKRIWGLIWIRQVDPLTFDDEGKRKYIGNDFFWIRRKHIEVFDTRQEIKRGQYPPLKHIVQICEDPDCEYHRVVHR